MPFQYWQIVHIQVFLPFFLLGLSFWFAIVFWIQDLYEIMHVSCIFLQTVATFLLSYKYLLMNRQSIIM